MHFARPIQNSLVNILNIYKKKKSTNCYWRLYSISAGLKKKMTPVTFVSLDVGYERNFTIGVTKRPWQYFLLKLKCIPIVIQSNMNKAITENISCHRQTTNVTVKHNEVHARMKDAHDTNLLVCTIWREVVFVKHTLQSFRVTNRSHETRYVFHEASVHDGLLFAGIRKIYLVGNSLYFCPKIRKNN